MIPWLAVLASAGEFGAGGYMRVMARPDWMGGNGRLGHWNLYGRLMNEGPYAVLDLRYDVLPPEPGSDAPTSSLHARIEGGAVGGAEPTLGNLAGLRLSQLDVEAGRVAGRDWTFRFGTLDFEFGELGLYDMRPASLMVGTVGGAATWRRGDTEVRLGVGDAGFALHGLAYDAVPTAGLAFRAALGDHVEIGGGAEGLIQPGVPGNVYAPYQTPGMAYEDWIRGTVVSSFVAENPALAEMFPDPSPRDAMSGGVVAYLGFGDVGPLRWSATYASYRRVHPTLRSVEATDDGDVDLYVTAFTDDRTRLVVGHESRLGFGIVEVAVGGLFGDDRDGDNQIAPTDHDRIYGSGVVRTQVALRPTVALLVETSLAREWSRNGAMWREHADSIFASTDGLPDADGLEMGDTDTRDTWQGKGGFVLQPLGPGLWSRPSLRLLYGVQQSNVNVAFGNGFVETVDANDAFGNVEIHTHHLVALEAEAWF